MRVLILGCGPAGLLAAHAAVEQGVEPIILSRKRKSPMRGAQYLHAPIPGLPRYEFKVNHVTIGDPARYRLKVYGARSHVAVSADTYQGLVPAWDVRAVYRALWASYGGLVTDWDASPANVVDAQQRYGPDVTISTVPAKLLCWHRDAHLFSAATVLISERAEFIPKVQDNLVVCSGEPWHPWYRQSRIHGWENTEYPARGWNGEPIMADDNPVKILKPVSTTCDCFPRIHRMGRYGRWEKSVLSHTAYNETKELIRGL